jgi:hypothetical protein
LTDAYFEDLQKQITRIKAMGPPKEVTKKSLVPHKATFAPSSFSSGEAQLQRRAGSSNMTDKETFKSKIPMKWPVAGTNKSTYTVRCVCLVD